MSKYTATGRLAALVALAQASSPKLASDVTLGGIVVHQPWSRATPGGAEVGGGPSHDREQGHHARPAHGRLLRGLERLRTAFHDDGRRRQRMRPAESVQIPPGGSLTLDPKGLHTMFTGLERALRRNESVPDTLTFEHDGTAKVDFAVGGIADKGPGGAAEPPHAGRAMPGTGMDRGAQP